MDVHELSIDELARKYRSRDIGVVEATQSYLSRIEKAGEEIGCYITVTAEKALDAANEAQKKIDAGDINPLLGIPMALKDNICTKGVLTSCASKMLSNFVPPYNATVAEKLNDAVMLGKLNMDEFAMGSSNENSWYGVVRNPWNKEYVPGGSSGGAAASVAAALAGFALGSDTGGSIRQPASFCGVVGLKPTYGAVSRFGLVAFASSLDQIGPVTKTVRDCGLVFNAICGVDEKDSTSAPVNHADALATLDLGVSGLKVGLPKENFADGLDIDTRTAVMRAVSALEGLGAVTGDCSIPAVEHAIPAYYLLSSAEASANLARYDGIRFGMRAEEAEDIKQLYRLTRQQGFGKEVKRRILLGTYALSSGYHDALYVKALKVRKMLHDEFNAAFEQYDVLISPTTPSAAFKIGEKAQDPLAMYLGDVHTVAVNLAGLPALVVPCGLDSKGMPIGIQLIGKPFSEQMLLRVGQAIETALGRFVAPCVKEGLS